MKDSPRAVTANGASPGSRPRPSSTNVARKSIQFNKLRPVVNNVRIPKERSHEDAKVAGLHGSQVVEQHARLQRRLESNFKGPEDGASTRIKELQGRLDESERTVRDLQSEVLALKTQIEKLQVLNVELESQKKKLEKDLSVRKSGFIDVLEVVPQKSENTAEMEVGRHDNCKNQSSVLNPITRAVEVQLEVLVENHFPALAAPLSPIARAPPPPPPPPPPHNARGRVTVHKASALAELYHSLTKQDGKQGSMNNGSCASPQSNKAHLSIVGELQNRSAHLLAIKADVETKGHLIKHLIKKVRSVSFASMEEVLTFVDWLDGELSTLADERAVLKHFDWPEKKADALREAAFEFRDLKRLEAEVSSFKDDVCLPCEATLKKISNLLDKLEQSVGRLIKLRAASMLLYSECKIPTDWMLESGMVCKMKQVSLQLARVYMRRVSMELESVRPSEKEMAQKALLFQGVRFAYRAHQARGLDSEMMFTIEELKKRVESRGRGQ
ncbi:unnamed protein product [Musa acuminata subsp. malaccensis]|uniref:(wild Malaysian banana) hypothetical protein n=1 Tax=Musa acuminata subsp. malaccensis TaxID=214687 RepID=A0A804K3E9_MUSAM|nr:unnamed protein product [Musa acuminata subsp. malaccensis]